MKQGTTTTFNFHFNIDLNQVDSIDFFFHCDRDNKQKREPLLTKSYPTDGYEQDGIIYMPLKQEETAVLPNKFYIEPQINFIDKSSTKAHTKAYNMEPTIYTHFIDENQSNGEEENIDIEFEIDESIVIKGYDYNESYHKPRINDNELAGNKTGAELGLQDKLIAGVNITIAADGKTISAANGGKFIIVEELPEEDIDLTAIYLLPREDEKENNIYDEYIYIENISEWEKIGSTEVNLENYYTKDETDELLDDKQDILSVIGHMSINNNVITTEANKVYQAVMNGDNISTDITDYPNIEMGDIAINYGNKIRIWVQTTKPHDFIFWSEIKYSNQKIIESENAPASSGYSSQYKVGDLWLQKIVGDTTTYKVFILVDIAQMIPPQTLTWVDLTSETEYTAGNGIDISNNEISVDISPISSNLLDFTSGKLRLNTNLISSDIGFRTSMPYDTTIRQGLADASTQNALASKSYVDTELAEKVDAVKSENNQVTLIDNTETNEMSVGDYCLLTFDTSHLEVGDELTLYFKIGNTWDSKILSNDSWYEYVFDYDAIKFKVKTAFSGETREFKYSLYNHVIRQRQYSREIGDIHNDLINKQDLLEFGNGLDNTNNTINVKLNEDYPYLVFTTLGDIVLDVNELGTDFVFRNILTNDSYNNPLVSKSYVETLAQALGNTLSVSIDSQTYVMTLQLKHNNQVLSTGTVDLPLETMVVNADYDNQTKEIVLTLQSGSTVRFSVADLVSGLVTESDFQDAIQDIEDALADKQDTIDNNNKLDADYVDDTNSTNKFVSANDITNWNAKADAANIYTKNEINNTVGNINNDISNVSNQASCGISVANNAACAAANAHNAANDAQNSANDAMNAANNAQNTADEKADKTIISTDSSTTMAILTLADNHEYRYIQNLTNLVLTMPSGDFIASVVFSSGSTPTQIVCDSNIKWSGEAVDNNIFTPEADTVYNIVFWYDGININAIERGVV